MPLNKAVILARFQSRAVVLNARSAPGMEDALHNVSGKAKCSEERLPTGSWLSYK